MEDAIVCKIQDNPDPVVFPLCAIGAKPLARVRLDDGSPDPYAPPSPDANPNGDAAAAAADAKPKTPPKGGKAPAETGPVNKQLTDGMVRALRVQGLGLGPPPPPHASRHRGIRTRVATAI